jgi:hypothetical protein
VNQVPTRPRRTDIRTCRAALKVMRKLQEEKGELTLWKQIFPTCKFVLVEYGYIYPQSDL